MSVLDIARVIVYRFHEKGLEIFLVQNTMDQDPDVWKLPRGIKDNIVNGHYEAIDLDDTLDDQGHRIRTLAVEGEWHDIPSIRGMLKHDIKLVKSKILESAPEMEKGGFFAVKEAFKKVLPEEYKVLKELKSVLRDRNLTKFI